MKKYLFTILSAAALTFTACDDILERPEQNYPSDQTFWQTETDARLFANGFYTNFFIGYGASWSASYSYFRGYTFSDDVVSTGQQSNFPTQPAQSGGYSTSEGISYITAASGPSWQFSWIRKANLMMERLEANMKGKVTDEAYNHWHAVAAFFKCFQYCRLVQVYGDVPWFETTFEDTDKETMFKDRDPRLTVMNNVYDLLKNEVLVNIYENDANGDGNTLNRYVAAAFAARWMLFEGTFQRYVEKNEEAAKKFLQLAVDAAEIVMNSGNYAISTPFREVFGSDDLLGNPEALLVQIHDGSLVKHCVASYQNGNEGQGTAANLALLKSFICQDGKVYQNSELENAKILSVTEMAKTRDPRFEATFLNHPDLSASGSLVYTSKFIDRFALTLQNPESNTLARYPEYNSLTNTNDAPVIRYAEVLLTWIEAKAELGTVTQDDINASINVLRDRPLDDTSIARGIQKTAPMVLADITADFDPARDADVDPLLWEIRRERRMEMAFEHSRLLDIKRWGKLHYMANPQDGTYSDNMLGAWVDLKNDANKMNGDNTFLTETNHGQRTVMKEDGTIVVWDGTNADDMVGYYVPNNIKPRLPFGDEQYLYPVSKALIDEYEDNGFVLSPTKGWSY